MPDHALAPEPPPAPRNPSGSYRVSLVCLGNICRSPTAEVVLREKLAQAGLGGKVEVDSSGTGNWHVGGPMDSGARAELAARGYDGSAHRARQFDRSWFGDYDLVVAMDRRNLADLRRMAPDLATARDRVRLLRSFDPATAGNGHSGGAAGRPGRDTYDGDVPDPYNGSASDYALAFDLVQAAASGLAAQLAALIGDGAGGAGGDGAGSGGAAGR
jgi:protein-tyrosine phosphatase